MSQSIIVELLSHLSLSSIFTVLQSSLGQAPHQVTKKHIEKKIGSKPREAERVNNHKSQQLPRVSKNKQISTGLSFKLN